jgi:hypothetical protein
MSLSAPVRGSLQDATTIAKTTQTIIGKEINCGSYGYITLFFSYVNGDETGLIIQAHVLQSAGGTEYQEQSWTAAAGERTVTTNQYLVTTSGNYYIVFDVRGIEYIKFTQGGSNNDGTPTGTLAASFTVEAG